MRVKKRKKRSIKKRLSLGLMGMVGQDRIAFILFALISAIIVGYLLLRYLHN